MNSITFHYVGKTDDGETFFDSHEGEPFELTFGMHMVMPKLEEGLKGAEPGEKRTIDVGMAYGDIDPSAVQKRILKETIEDGFSLQEGMEVMWTSPRNTQRPIPAKIVRADDLTFDIDFNQEKYLIETRISGALTRAYSAIALEEPVSDVVSAVGSE